MQDSKGLLLLACVLAGCGEVPTDVLDEADAAVAPDPQVNVRLLEDLTAFVGGPPLYLIDGDIVTSQPELYVDHLEHGPTLEELAADGEDKLIGNPKPGHGPSSSVYDMTRWDGRRWSLTYCITNDWAPFDKQAVIDAMAAATAEWEAAAGVHFEYKPEYDYRCYAAADEVTFRVTYTVLIAAWGASALAFMPNAPLSDRVLHISPLALDPESLEPNRPHMTTERILAHEVGHILGFRHEHIRDSDCTSEEGPYITLTPLDRNSIMYYPYCNATYIEPLGSMLTAFDRLGAAIAYPNTSNPSLHCGDGVRQASEACDDGNDVSYDGCSEGCLYVENGFVCATAGSPCVMIHCGNGVLDPGEDCDGTAGCPSTCAYPTYDPEHPNGSFCSASGYRCSSGEGDCDTDADCMPNLVCAHDVGDMYGLPGLWDVCVLPGCPVYTTTPPGSNYCGHPGCKCSEGEGDCDSDAQCTTGLYCRIGVGASYGLPAGWDVCVPPVCGNSIVEPGEECDDGNKIPTDGCDKCDDGHSCPWQLPNCDIRSR